MTFREKLKIEHPDKIGSQHLGGCSGCPDSYGYEVRSLFCRVHESGGSHRSPSPSKCFECWSRTIPGTENPSIKPDLNALIERAATKRDISVSIFITGDTTHISVYPCPDPSEKKGNPVAEAYRLLVNSSYKTPDIAKAIDHLGEALENG